MVCNIKYLFAKGKISLVVTLVLLFVACSKSTNLTREVILYDSGEVLVSNQGESLSILFPCKGEDNILVYHNADWIDFNSSIVNVENKVNLKLELKVERNVSKQQRVSKIHINKESGDKEIFIIQQ